MLNLTDVVQDVENFSGLPRQW